MSQDFIPLLWFIIGIFGGFLIGASFGIGYATKELMNIYKLCRKAEGKAK
jgi:hypothetical protein